MSSDRTSRTLITLAAIGLALWAVWVVRDVLPPFLIALALALLLDPLHDRMQRRGLPRGAAVAITFAGFLAAFVGVIAFLLPRAFAQVRDLLQNVELYGARLQRALDTWSIEHAEDLRRMGLPATVSDLWQQYQVDVGRYVQLVLQRVFEGLQASAGLLGWLVLIPIVTLYLLIDLDRFQARLLHVIPEAHRETAGLLALQVGRVFSAYLRGLTAICAAYGLLVYVVLLVGFQLPYALILGLTAAVLYAIPYLGQLALIGVCLVVAWVTGYGAPQIVGLVIALILVGQLFDQLVTPRVIGRQVGLHPVIGLFALMVGGQLFGLAGMVIAVPVAASARVVLIHLFPRLGEPLPAKAAEPDLSSEPQAHLAPHKLNDGVPGHNAP